MGYGGENKWRSPRTSGGIPRVGTRFSLNKENEQTGAGRNGRTWLARSSSQARTGTGKNIPFPLATNRIGHLTPLICTLLYMVTMHTYIHNIYYNVHHQLPPVIGVPRACCGYALRIFLPRPLRFGGCASHATPSYVPGYSYCTLSLKKHLNASNLSEHAKRFM